MTTGTQVASLFGVIDLKDNMTSALQSAQGALGNFSGSLSGAMSGLKEFGAAASLGLTAPIVAGLTACVKAASDTEDSITQLDTVLKSTNAANVQTAATMGHWATATDHAGAVSGKTADKIEKLTAHIHDMEAKWNSSKTHTESATIALDQAREKLAALQPAFTGAAEGTKVWVAATQASNSVSHMAEQSYIDLAYSMEGLTKFSHNAVLGAEDMLLTFRNIGKDVFPDATKTVLDMSQALGQDLKSSSIQLGKALDDPIKGVTALHRVGVEFTKAQEDQIKALVKSGDVMSAQKLILKELQTEFGGSAEAAGTTFSGKLAIAQHSVESLMSMIGDYMLPILSDIVTSVTGVVNSLFQFNPAIVQAGLMVAIAIAAIGPLAGIIGVIGGALAFIISPIGLIAVAVGALALAFATNFGGIRDATMQLWNSVAPTLQNLQKIAADFIATLFPAQSYSTQQIAIAPQHKNKGALGDEGDPEDQVQKTKTLKTNTTPPFIDNLIKAVSEALPKLQSAIGDLLTKAAAFVETLNGKFIDGVSGWVQSGINWLINEGTGLFVKAVSSVVGIKPEIIKATMEVAFQGIKDAVTDLVGDGPGSIKATLGTAIDSIFGKTGTFAMAIVGAQNLIKPFSDALTGVGTALSKAFSGLTDIMTAPFKAVILFIGQVLEKAGSMGGVFSSLKGYGDQLVAAATDQAKPANNAPLGLGVGALPGPNGLGSMSEFGHATGGAVGGNSPIMVGEQGPEWFIPGASGNIIPNGSLTGTNGGGAGKGQNTINIGTVIMQSVSNVPALYDQLEKEAGRRNMTLGLRRS